MAARNLLHKSKLEEFSSWLINKGWEIEKPRGDYEVLRAYHIQYRDPLIVYEKIEAKEHYTIQGRHINIVKKWLDER